MTKKKRTLEEVIATQKKAVRFQESLGNVEAASRLEDLEPEDYAAFRNIEIVDEPVQKRRRRKKKEDKDVPPGYVRHTEVEESNESIEGGFRKTRVTKTWIAPVKSKEKGGKVK